MEGEMVFEGLFQKEGPPSSSSEVLDSLWISNSSSTSFHGENNTANAMKPFFAQIENDENCDEDYEKCFHQPEKKRRLSVDQVKFLEKSFEVDNKLEPERKVKLAKELDLQPRQVAIWFQNRRARYKTKQLEKDYDSLKSNYDKLRLDFDSLQKENDNLKHEVEMLQEKLLEKEKGEQDSLECGIPIAEMESHADKPISNPIPVPVPVSTNMVICKQEDANSISAKSDIVDSNSSHYADSSNVFENQSDFSQDEEDNLSKNILVFPKTEYESYIDPNESCLGYPVEDQSFWMWA